jgi:hypothetical protein
VAPVGAGAFVKAQLEPFQRSTIAQPWLLLAVW